MLPLLITFLASVYLYAPGLVFRWAVGLVVGRENLKQPVSKVEETTQALIWITIPLSLTAFWVWFTHALAGSGMVSSFEALFSGLYSETTFRSSPPQFYGSFVTFLRANLHILWRLYLLVGSYAVLASVVLWKSRQLYERDLGWMVRLALITSPPLAEWFTWLSGISVPSSFEIHADVLTKTGGLYQGRVDEYALEPTGALRLLAVGVPRRFLRDQFEEARKGDDQTRTDRFWKSIPGNLFVIAGSDIANVNLRYVRRKRVIAKLDDLTGDRLRDIIARAGRKKP